MSDMNAMLADAAQRGKWVANNLCLTRKTTCGGCAREILVDLTEYERAIIAVLVQHAIIDAQHYRDGVLGRHPE